MPDVTTTTEARATTTPTTEPEIDPFTVPADPADYTPEYVEAVLNELAALRGDALRMIVEAEAVTNEADALLATVLSPGFHEVELASLNETVDQMFGGVISPPGDIEYGGVSISQGTSTCIAASVLADNSQVAESGGPAQRVLELRNDLNPPAVSNPTGWVIAIEGLDDETAEGLDLCIG